jgi:hypothetical protein
MSDSSHTQDQNTGTQATTREYSLEEIQTLSLELMLKYEINNELGQLAFHPISGLPKENPAKPRLVRLAQNPKYNREFLKTERFNMSIIDLKSDEFKNHEAVARFLADDLTPPAGEKRTTWVIHMFCSNNSWSQNLGPVGMVILMLHFISTKLTDKTNTKNHQWGSFRVQHKPTTKETRRGDYQKIIEILKGLISRILENCAGHAMHFIFSGIMIDKNYPERTLRNLARFVIDMARIVGYVDPFGANRMVKCVFCGARLLGPEYLIRYLVCEKKKERDSGEEEIKDKYRRMLMLAWDRKENDYDELHW